MMWILSVKAGFQGGGMGCPLVVPQSVDSGHWSSWLIMWIVSVRAGILAGEARFPTVQVTT